MSTTTINPIELNNEEITNNIYNFLNSLKGLLNSCIDYSMEKRRYSREDNFLQTFESINEAAFFLITRERTNAGLLKWLSTLDLQQRIIISLIASEMQYFTERFPTTMVADKITIQRPGVHEERGSQLSDGIENGKTIKESFEKFIGKKLTKLFKKPLSVLNELLSIAKTFI